MAKLGKQDKAASRELAKLTTAEKNQCLAAMADALEREASAIKSANALDMQVGANLQLSAAMLDRLKLDDKRISSMAKALREVAALPAGAVALARKLMRGDLDDLARRVDTEAMYFKERLQSEEARTAFAAFLARKK